MGLTPLTQQIALGVGAGGALVDVSSRIAGPEGVTFSYGRQDEFRDPSPGQITFTLENQDGLYTPNNPASTLATSLIEGTQVVWNCAGRLVQMQVSAIGFASSEDQWGRIAITANDALYIANRTTLTNLAASIAAAQPYLWWPMNEPAGSAQAIEQSGNLGPALGAEPPTTQGPTLMAFGQAASAPLGGDTELLLTSGPSVGESDYAYLDNRGPLPAISYPAGSLGCWGFWTEAGTAGTIYNGFLGVSLAKSGVEIQVYFGSSLADGKFLPTLTVAGVAAANSGGTGTLPVGPHYLAVQTTYSGTNFTTTLHVDGAQYASATWSSSGLTSSPLGGPSAVRFLIGTGTGTGSARIAHLSHTAALIHEEAAGVTTIGSRFVGLCETVPQITPGTVDSNVSPQLIDQQNTSGSNALTAIADLLRTEQGHLYFATSGSLLAPSTVLNLRSRVRSTTIAQSFDAQAEVQGVPQFVRDITNMYATITANGPSHSATAVDRTLFPRVGSAYTSETVLYGSDVDQLLYAQDRLLRGENVNLKVVSLVVDVATVAATQQQATLTKLLALTPGDRVEITNLPSTSLGFSAWDGWFLGGSEVHNTMSDAFTLYFAPVLAPTGIFDTDLFADGGTVTLNAALTATATTMTVASSDGVTWFEQTAVPYTITIDSEQLTVTAAAAPASGSQTLTVTRGVNGTTAASHAAAAIPEIVSTSNTFAF